MAVLLAAATLLPAVTAITSVNAQEAPPIEWTRQFGTASGDYASAISVDSTGIYMAGSTDGTLPGQSSAGGSDAFVRKYDASGNELWTRQFGTASGDYALGISVDSTGIYVAGYTDGILPGQSSAGDSDAFVRKYDASGNEVWTRQFGTASYDFAYGISVDSTGIYVAGHTYGTFPGQSSASGIDAFVRRYDADGNEVWTRQFGTDSDDYANSISVDSTGIYVAGSTQGTLPGQSSDGGTDAFVRKYDADGNVVWTRQFGTASYDYALVISVDSTGIYVGGYTDGTLPGQSSAGGWDAFVRRYDASGNEVWTSQFGTASTDQANGISVDSTGIYVAGPTYGTLPGQSSAGYSDVFVRRYDASGNEVWTRQFGSASNDQANGISVDSTGIYVVGWTRGTLPSQSIAGGWDAFVAKLAYTPVPPTVTTNAATDIGTTSATLNGYLDDMGTATSVQVSFQWGKTTGYGNETTAQTMSSTGPFSASLSTLAPDTTYHFRAKAVGDSTAYGDDMTFTTGISITGITGEVNCNILPFAYVELRQGATVIDSTTSDAEGNFLLTAPAPGTYDIVVDKNGYRPITQQITISGAGTITMDFIGQTGLVPNAPSVQYVAQCSNHYLYPYGNCGLTVQKVAAVSNAYLYPVSE
jgi:hypothetical protein